ncbi:MAG TPA: PHB depolymerase family esterase [Polyangiaceae bacterium]|nr:PHB depolymerase family esterase [Polyangiaceae bacterium]
MTRRSLWIALLAVALTLGAVAPARAASLQQVSNWGASGVPTYVAMYIYVPDKPAPNPAIVVVSHYCTGDAAGMFNQAKTSGLVAASDQYGFIMIFPQNHQPGTTRNCWDVGSKESLTHDGGGDTQAIAQMVKHTITQYKANPNRVYAAGSSSGAMMTQALLAVYPDIFKAGAEFSGVPAGCWADGYAASNQWSDSCAGGKTVFTAAQWGDKARAMYPGYSGPRARVQLWHGDADEIIHANNFSEAIEQWTNVLGLAAQPTTTSTVSLSGKSWTRQSWQNTCGFTVLDAWLEKGGVHNITANLNAQYIVPFFGLDKAGDVDPQVGACAGTGGATGGSSGSGGSGVGGIGGAGGGSGEGGGSGSGAGGSGGVGSSIAGQDAGAGRDAGASGIGTGASGNGALPQGGSVASGGKTAAGGPAANGGSAGSPAQNSGPSGCACTLHDDSRGSRVGSAVAIAALALAGYRRRRRNRIC